MTSENQIKCPSCGGRAESTYQNADDGTAVHECANGHTWHEESTTGER